MPLTANLAAFDEDGISRLAHHFTDYEGGKIDKMLLETRIERFSGELTELRRCRDKLQLRIDDPPQQITPDQLANLGNEVNDIVHHGTDTERRHLCALLIHELRIDTATGTATPIFRSTSPHQRRPETPEAPRPVTWSRRKSPAHRMFASVDP